MTDATPLEFVTAITWDPLVVPLERVPPPVEMENKMVAPAALPPDCPGANVTVNGWGSVLPPAPL